MVDRYHLWEPVCCIMDKLGDLVGNYLVYRYFECSFINFNNFLNSAFVQVSDFFNCFLLRPWAFGDEFFLRIH